MISTVSDWVKSRLKERTSHDGIILIVLGVLILIGAPFVKLGAWIAIGWGAWTIWSKD
jgi:hypothetical protein|tara:strand:+ start:290 stop:463 length:174 start_codon:yes stop_codon:yes gene_type:complete